VCLSVCLLAYLKNHVSKFHKIFCRSRPICYVKPWLGPHWTTVQYVMYFSVVDNVRFSRNGGNVSESNTTRSFPRVRHVAAAGAKSIYDCRLVYGTVLWGRGTSALRRLHIFYCWHQPTIGPSTNKILTPTLIQTFQNLIISFLVHRRSTPQMSQKIHS